VIQFLAQDDETSTRVLDDPRLGWQDFCRSVFQVHRVPGSHGTLLAESQAARIGAILADWFRAAAGADPVR